MVAFTDYYDHLIVRKLAWLKRAVIYNTLKIESYKDTLKYDLNEDDERFFFFEQNCAFLVQENKSYKKQIKTLYKVLLEMRLILNHLFINCLNNEINQIRKNLCFFEKSL